MIIIKETQINQSIWNTDCRYSLLYPLFPSLQRPAFNAVSTTTTKVKSRLKSIYLYNTSLESIKLLWFVVLFKMLLYNLFCCKIEIVK